MTLIPFNGVILKNAVFMTTPELRAYTEWYTNHYTRWCKNSNHSREALLESKGLLMKPYFEELEARNTRRAAHD